MPERIHLNKYDFKYSSQKFHNNVFDLVKEKGFDHDEYMNDFEKFKEELPCKEKFYSSLTDKKISDKEYEHVPYIWKKCDFLLSADGFENFRDKNDGLCLSHYLSAPSLSWDVMLKMRKIKLEIISDSDMYILFEKGTRGEISYIFNRHSKGNNKYLKSYDSKQESKHIICSDTNNYMVMQCLNFFQQVNSDG